MMDREVALEALGALCNATVTSVQRPGVGLPAADIVGAAGFLPLTVYDLVHRVVDGDAFRPVREDAFGGVPSLQESGTPICTLSVEVDETGKNTGKDTGKDSRGRLILVVDEKEFFDPGFDYDFTKITDRKTFYRGGEVYERPCGWTRFALKVLGKYDEDTWLGNNRRTTDSVEGEWPVSYHGTTREGAEDIIPEHYEAGNRAKYGRGVYSTPHISVAEGYARSFKSDITKKRYKVLLQNRINPKYRKICDYDKYWLVEIPKGTSKEKEKEMVDRAIRPYGLLIKEI